MPDHQAHAHAQMFVHRAHLLSKSKVKVTIDLTGNLINMTGQTIADSIGLICCCVALVGSSMVKAIIDLTEDLMNMIRQATVSY